LLEKNKGKRIGKNGIKEILAHPFFASLDIDALMRRELEPGYKPEIKEGELKYFPDLQYDGMSILPKDK